MVKALNDRDRPVTIQAKPLGPDEDLDCSTSEGLGLSIL